MKVAINTIPLSTGHRTRGIGFYTKNLVKALEKESRKKKGLKIEAFNFKKKGKRLSHYDLIHYPFFAPFFLTLPLKKPTKTIVTIHDLIPLIYPKHYQAGIRGRLKFFIQKSSLQTVAAVITDSETSKKDIVRFLNIPSEKVFPIHLASAGHFRKLTANSTALDRVRKKYDLPRRFVLYVGDINYNKNILTLIKACRTAKTPLVIVGKQAMDIEDLGLGLDSLRGPRDWIRYFFGISHPEEAHYRGLLDYFHKNAEVIRLGYVSDEDLVGLYNLAAVYCQPSFYEGFGLPVLEAMACGCPVVASKTQALVEIAGDVALFVDPKKPKDIAKKTREIIENDKLRQKLIRRGKRFVARFSWEKTAKQTIRVYEQIMTK